MAKGIHQTRLFVTHMAAEAESLAPLQINCKTPSGPKELAGESHGGRHPVVFGDASHLQVQQVHGGLRGPIMDPCKDWPRSTRSFRRMIPCPT